MPGKPPLVVLIDFQRQQRADPVNREEQPPSAPCLDPEELLGPSNAIRVWSQSVLPSPGFLPLFSGPLKRVTDQVPL